VGLQYIALSLTTVLHNWNRSVIGVLRDLHGAGGRGCTTPAGPSVYRQFG
jgi:hypothetical protein